MIAEERSVKHLLDELLGYSGCNIAVVPATRYCDGAEEISFFQLAKRARKIDDGVVLGYRNRHDGRKTILNPPDKDERMEWTDYDIALLTSKSSARNSSRGGG